MGIICHLLTNASISPASPIVEGNMHILSVAQFAKNDIEELCARADFHSRHPSRAAQDKILANLFYEPSTRTSSSFYSAMVRLGGHVIPINNVAYSSVAKGETLEDTIRTMQCYADVIVLRHTEIGAAERAAAVAAVPIINAGDGMGEHPTQALLDFYTIRKEIGTVGGLHVVMMGDLFHGRTVRSLAMLLRRYDVRISWVSPSSLRVASHFVLPGEIETAELDDVIADADVLYLTRVQKERLSQPLPASDYAVTEMHMARAKPTMALLHPLPRVTELPCVLDSDPRAAYFRQMRYGLFMRMGILAKVLEAASILHRDMLNDRHVSDDCHR
jgi:aspartate carbamoyltransferase